MTNLKQLPEKQINYLDFVVLLSAGVAFTLLLVWLLSFSSFNLSITQKQIVGVIPMLIGVAKWSSDRLRSIWKVVQHNSDALQRLEEERSLNQETIRGLEKDALWMKVQIENLYAQVEQLKEGS